MTFLLKQSRNLYVFIIWLLVAMLCMPSCNNRRQQEIDALIKERDSLQNLSHMQDSVQAVIDSYVETIAETLDSIRTQENILTLKVDENGRRLRNNEIKQNLELLADIIRRQRERIEALEGKLSRQGVDSSSHYRIIIAHLYAELDAKNAKITEMENDIEMQSRTIAQLNKRVANLESDVDAISNQAKEQAETIAIQTEILTAQSEMLNVGYVIIGTRKDLQDAGVLSKGLFSGGRIDTSSIDLSKFEQIDIRNFNDITCQGRHVKLLSSHPASSYTITEVEKGTCVLTVTDPGAFWSLTNYVVIQL